MKIVFIGAGNVATHLATELYKYDFDIIQIYSRTLESADLLAKQVKATAITDVKAISTDADLYIFAISDAAIEDTITQMPLNKGLWVHTAGSIPMEVFSKYTIRYGVIYPFQTFSKNRSIDWREIPLFIEAFDNNDLETVENIAKRLSDKVITLDSEKRKFLHLTGVFANNFTNYMYTLSEEILKEADLPFDVALPLIDETAAKVHKLSPVAAQTGPAVRDDENVMNAHIALIKDENTREIYKLISKSIYQTKKSQ